MRDDGIDLTPDGTNVIYAAPGTVLELAVISAEGVCAGDRWQWQGRGAFDDSTVCPATYTVPEPFDADDNSDEVVAGQHSLFVDIVQPETTAVHFVMDGALRQAGSAAAEQADEDALGLALSALLEAENQPNFETFQTGLRAFADGDCTVDLGPTLPIRSRSANHQRLLNHTERIRELGPGGRTADAPVHDVIRHALQDVERVPELQFGGSFIIWVFLRGFDNCEEPGEEIPIPTLEKEEGSVFFLTIIDTGWNRDDIDGTRNLGSFLDHLGTYSRVEAVECRTLISAEPFRLSDEEPCPEPGS